MASEPRPGAVERLATCALVLAAVVFASSRFGGVLGSRLPEPAPPFEIVGARADGAADGLSVEVRSAVRYTALVELWVETRGGVAGPRARQALAPGSTAVVRVRSAAGSDAQGSTVCLKEVLAHAETSGTALDQVNPVRCRP